MTNIQRSIQDGLLRPIRKLGLGVARHWPWPVPVQITSGRRMYVDLRSAVGRGIFMKGSFDLEVFEPLKKTLKKGDIFLDIGANVGFYSMLALDVVGSTGEVHAFEIDPRPLRCLRKTVITQQLQNVFVHEVAVGEFQGTAQLTQTSDCGHSMVRTGGNGVTVAVTNLDSWRDENNVRGISAIKVDVEGSEYGVLRGAKGILRSDRPVVVTEAAVERFPRGTVYEKAELISFFESLDYSVRWLANVCSPTIVAIPRTH